MATNKKLIHQKKGEDVEDIEATTNESVAQPSPSEEAGSRGVSLDSALLSDLNKKLEEIEKKFQDKVDEMNNAFEEKLDDREDKFDIKIDGRELRIMEVLSIFVVIITFVSTNITIFARIDSLATAVWFMILMTVCLTFLVSFLFLVLNNYRIVKVPFPKWGIFISIGAMLVLALALILFPSLNRPLNPASDTVQGSINQLNQQYQFEQTEIETLNGTSKAK
jgi:magnesium-transporting ATPase (P-type)